MTEILDDLVILARPTLDLSKLLLAGVPFGCAATSFPRSRVTAADLSPIVATQLFDRSELELTRQFGPGRGATRYFDERSATIPLARVIDSVLRHGGILHLAEEVSFRLEGGIVTRFSLYGAALRDFAASQTGSDVFASFGSPDRLLQLEAEGVSVAHDAYYAGSRKWVRWDDRHRRLAFIMLGGSVDEIAPGVLGGLIRRECSVASA